MRDAPAVAWAAGLFEGEGCFMLHGRRRGHPNFRCRLGMTDEDVVRAFARVVGVGSVYLRPRQKKNYKDQWVWEAYGKDAESVYDLLQPWLHSRRRERWAAMAAERKAYERIKPANLSARSSAGRRNTELRKRTQDEALW